MVTTHTKKSRLFNIPGYSLELPQCDSSEYPKIHMTVEYIGMVTTHTRKSPGYSLELPQLGQFGVSKNEVF